MADAMLTGPLGFAPVGMFIGPNAKTWDKTAAQLAQKLDASGADPRAIWKQTGTFKGPDGKWRQEIDDSGAKLRDYNYTPQEAYKEARERAFIDDVPSDAVRSMAPYAGMSKGQLTAEYKRTGGEIVDAALSGDKAKALQLASDRSGLDGLFGAMRDRNYGPMSVFLKHGELGQAYPDVYKMHTRIADDLADGTKGQYMRGQPGIGEQVQLANKPQWSDDKSSILHELQHAIQQREGFARGGSPEQFKRLQGDYSAYVKSSNSLQDAFLRAKQNGGVDPESGMSLKGIGDSLKEVSSRIDGMKAEPWWMFGPTDAYMRLAGEAEARATQARMNMGMQQRRDLFPLDSYDVPIDQLILR
jgi:hypothetical protein